jgi:hypothetical protein
MNSTPFRPACVFAAVRQFQAALFWRYVAENAEFEQVLRAGIIRAGMISNP